MKALAVQGCTFKCQPPGQLVGTAQVITPPSLKVSAEGKPCYKGNIDVLCPPGSIQHPAFSASNMVNTAPATFTISPLGITKTKIEGDLALTQGDNGSATVQGLQPPPPPATTPIPAVAAVILEIDDPGQTKAQSN